MDFLKEFLETEEGKDIRSKVEEHIQFNTENKCPNMKLSEILEIKYDITEEPDSIIISESFANEFNQPIFGKKEIRIEKEATNLASEKVAQVQTEKQKEYQRKVETKDDIINNLAQLIIEENEAMLGKDVAEKAKDKVRKERKSNV